VAKTVGIIGAGFSGLLAAYFLEQAFDDQLEVVVFEASGRVGGRVRSPIEPETHVRYEAGAAEFYDIKGSPNLKSLVRHLGLEIKALTGTPHFVVNNEVVRNERALIGLLGQRGVDRLRCFWERGTALRPPQDYALAGREQDNTHPWLRRTFEDVLSEIDDAFCQWFTAMQCHSDLATEPPHATGLFGMDNLLIDHPDYCSMYTLVGGNESIIKALRNRVHAKICLHAPVTQVAAHGARGIRLTYDGKDNESIELDVDGLLVTLPPRGVRKIRWLDAKLEAAVADHVKHHDHATDYVRVTLFCRRRFWSQQFPEDYFVSDAFGGVTVYDQSPDGGGAGVGVQSWLLAGASAREQAVRSDHEVVRAVLQAMPASTPLNENLLVSSSVDRWTGTSGVCAKPGGVPLRALNRRHSPDVRWPEVQFVGDYLYDSTLCGALDAVMFAVDRLTETLGPKTITSRSAMSESLKGSRPKSAFPLSTAFFLDAL
tara:strand:+ start:10622 stop:12076 length:1455 start_codon:yes stop_codon:yes gene_type:complete